MDEAVRASLPPDNDELDVRLALAPRLTVQAPHGLGFGAEWRTANLSTCREQVNSSRRSSGNLPKEKGRSGSWWPWSSSWRMNGHGKAGPGITRKAAKQLGKKVKPRALERMATAKERANGAST